MSAQNLVALERAKLNCSGAATSDDRTIDAMIGACSEAIQKYCGRTFSLTRHDEVLDGCISDQLMLREWPIQAVESVRYGPQTVLQVCNTSTSTNQQARVAVTSTGLELTRTASGVRVIDTTVTWSSNVTLTAVATAVIALGSGWTAQVSSGYSLWPSQDLYQPCPYSDSTQSQGAFNCLGSFADLSLHVSELSGYCWDYRGWIYRRDPWADEQIYDERAWYPWMGSPGFWRVVYTAGYNQIPDALQEACAQWVSWLWKLTTRDPALTSSASAPFEGTATSSNYVQILGMPPSVRALIDPWRRRKV